MRLRGLLTDRVLTLSDILVVSAIMTLAGYVILEVLRGR